MLLVLKICLLLLLVVQSIVAFSIPRVGIVTCRHVVWINNQYSKSKESLFSCTSKSSTTCLHSTSDGESKQEEEDDSGLSSSSSSFVLKDPILLETVKTLRRASWFSWWSQVILTTISSVILIFARSVMNDTSTNTFKQLPSFVLSGTGIILSGLSIVWTWGNGARLSRRLQVKQTTRIRAANMVRRAIRVGVTVNLAGLFCNLLAAQQIIGSLAIKVLTNRASLFTTTSSLLEGGLQPLDVLVVQANANSLLAQFCSLASLLFLVKNVDKLDPPSTDEKPRNNN